MSSKLSGWSFLISSFMPRDSSWNTAVVSQRCSSLKASASLGSIRLMSIGASPSASRWALMVRSAQSMMVSVRRPRKSNLTRPACSTSSLSYWVTRLAPPGSQYSGAKSVSLVGAMTTPPACLPALRATPSSLRAMSMMAVTASSSA
jgi:hypothetical protein